MNIIITLLLVALLPLVCSQCSSITNESTCINYPNCSWAETSIEACQPQVSCPNLSQIDCQSNDLSGQCDWNPAIEGKCSIVDSACDLSDPATDTCKFPQSCVIYKKKTEYCNPLKNKFECSQKSDQPTCSDATQCTWLSSTCHTNNTCENQSLLNCDATNCAQRVTACILKITANKTCSAFTDYYNCTQAGCQYNFSPGQCVPPDSCTVTSDNKCASDVCIASEGTCIISTATCSSSTEQECNSDFCEWNSKYPVCIDNTSICSLPDCSNKTYCVKGSITQTTCVPKQGTNQCDGLTSSQCSDGDLSKLCQYSTGSESSCTNKVNCGSFMSSSDCSTNSQNCKWGNKSSFVCKTVVSPSNSKAIDILVSINLLIIISLVI